MAPKIDVSQRTLRRMEAGEAPIKRGTWKLVEELLAEHEKEGAGKAAPKS